MTKPSNRVRGRALPEGAIPLIDCEGTTFDCGIMLGRAWREALHLTATKVTSKKPWWKAGPLRKLIARHAPHLPDLYRGMAQGAGLDENLLGPRAPMETGGCSSFAIAPSATLDGAPISGQTKDVSWTRALQLRVVRMKMSDGMSMLTLTYPGWLYGHGFVRGGTAIYRNSLYVTPRDRGLAYDVWGLLALHCPTVDEVKKLTRDFGCVMNFHVAVADEVGGIVGIENGKGGPALLKPTRGTYAHANAVLSGARMRKHEKEGKLFKVADSLHRGTRLQERLQADRGRLTAQLAHAALCDHTNYPASLCRHQHAEAWTGAAVVSEPTRGLLHVTRGAPCQNWPTTYRL